jgi:hypothetical protein
MLITTGGSAEQYPPEAHLHLELQVGSAQIKGRQAAPLLTLCLRSLLLQTATSRADSMCNSMHTAPL